jgi:hypothetical protein
VPTSLSPDIRQQKPAPTPTLPPTQPTDPIVASTAPVPRVLPTSTPLPNNADNCANFKYSHEYQLPKYHPSNIVIIHNSNNVKPIMPLPFTTILSMQSWTNMVSVKPSKSSYKVKMQPSRKMDVPTNLDISHRVE